MPKHIIGGICKNREMDIIEKVKKYNFEDSFLDDILAKSLIFSELDILYHK